MANKVTKGIGANEAILPIPPKLRLRNLCQPNNLRYKENPLHFQIQPKNNENILYVFVYVCLYFMFMYIYNYIHTYKHIYIYPHI